uniref:Uncharacterized protein n=1 Tax=Tanacetum cinerariifolium TaxID=118510 RepID=A0A6L2L9D5_TANCI|nr:hypothetical protein [Tanacetum cinerariifolium]
MQQIQDKAKKSCMVSFQKHPSHLKCLSQNDLQGSQTESGFKRAFATLSCQDNETFTGTMFLNVEQLEKQLAKEDFQEIGSMAAFIDTSSRSRNDAHDDGADIKPIYDEEPMAEVQTTAEIDVFAIGKQHTKQPEFNNEGEVVQNAKYCHDTWKPMSQPHRNRSVVRQPTTFKSERPRISKPWCDSQVDVHNDLSKPVITHYLPKEREAASAKPHHMIPSSNSRISSKNMPRFTSNDMVHNHYQEEANEKTQECSRNSEPSLMSSARSKSTANGSKPVPRRNTQTSRNWPASKNSFVTKKTVPIAEHHKNSRNDSCVTKFPKDANSHAKVPSNKTPKRNKPVEQITVSNKQERQIPTGDSFSIQKNLVGLRWVPTRRILTSSTTKVYSEPLNGSNADITNQYECEQILDVSAVKMEILLEPTTNKLLKDSNYLIHSYVLSALRRSGLDNGVAASFQWS